jgi:hypothetical protein
LLRLKTRAAGLHFVHDFVLDFPEEIVYTIPIILTKGGDKHERIFFGAINE